ncbi:MAG: hypothetical protein JXQ23_00755, partial [Clostridia bacterium]|nr:hypothetical protein [Clostridia bacterium]
DDVIRIYKYLKKKHFISIADLQHEFEPYKIYLTMFILKELQLIDFDIEGIVKFKNIVLNNNKCKLDESSIYHLFNRKKNE